MRSVISLFAALLAMSAPATSAAELDRAMADDGLQKISIKGVDMAYARPGATLVGYSRVMLDPIDVTFRKDWKPTRSGSNIKVSAQERDNIAKGVAKVVFEEFVKQLQSDSDYQMVSEAGPNVLRVKAKIVDLYLNAPDTGVAGRSRSYTVSAGEMTLFAELYDSQSGELLARVADRHVARHTGRLTLTSSVVNAEEVRSAAASWARTLRDALDKAHGIGKR
jgi:hypothetical protein